MKEQAENKNSTSQFLKTDGGKTKSNILEVPSIALPKGGGAIKSIDEKFTVNPVNGTSSFSIPLPVSPARQGFSPSLNLSYNSGSGNGIFGLGWGIDMPAITRKTNKGLPQYLDDVESDVYMFSGAEDLVPYLEIDINKKWNTREYAIKDADNIEYQVKRYRPRIEGLFAKIERWTNPGGNIYWKVTTKDNVVSIFGKNPLARVADPENPKRVFKWLPEFSFDDKGNCILYEYKAENLINVPNTVSEEHRHNGNSKFCNTYLEKVKYGAKTPYKPGNNQLPDFMFETVFDYSITASTITPEIFNNANWNVRNDAFSIFNACFEMRTYRLCHRVLLFHHFDELGNDPYLAKSLDIDYTYDAEAGLNLLSSLTSKGYKKISNHYKMKALPPMTFNYEAAGWNTEVKTISPENLINAPVGIDDLSYAWIDLFSEGVSGILTEQGNAWWYKQNLGEGEFTTAAVLLPKPSLNGLNSAVHIQELEADGRKFLVSQGNELPGYFEMTEDNDWLPFQAFKNIPNIDFRDPNVKFIDLNGDGKADLFINEENAYSWYPSGGIAGFDDYHLLAKEFDEDKGPLMVYTDPSQSIMLTDINGDGLTDIVRIRNGEIVYWPNMGYGKFGAKVVMDNAPLLDAEDSWNPQYMRLTDINGTGTPDLVYLGKNYFQVWFNQNGNSWSSVKEITCFPEVNNLSHITTIDLLANGTSCITWSSPLPAHSGSQLRYIDLMQGKKPFVMTSYENNLGKKVSMEYKSSSYYYLQDKKAGKQWITKLPFPVQCVEKVIVEDQWRKTKFATTYSYHHGYFDYPEREFRGFGRVEQVDVESFGKFQAGNADSPYITTDKTLYQPPVKTITWLHTGAASLQKRILKQFEEEYFPHSLVDLPGNITIDNIFKEKTLPEPDLDSQELSAVEWREALRACKGMTLRQEVYELDVDKLEENIHYPVRLFSSATHNSNIRRLQPGDNNKYAVFLVTESEALTYHYELELSKPSTASDHVGLPLKPDPRIAHTLNLSFNEYGSVQQSIAVAYPRTPTREYQVTDLNTGQLDLIHQVQQETHLAYSEIHYTNDAIETFDPSKPDLYYRLQQPYEVRTYELTGIIPLAGFYFKLEELACLKLSSTYPAKVPPQPVIPTDKYFLNHLNTKQLPPNTKKYTRLVEHARTLFFKDDLSGALDLGVLGRLGLPYEQYKLALTDALLNAIINNTKLNEVTSGGTTVYNLLNNWKISGYLSGIDVTQKFGLGAAGQYWMRSGIAGFASVAVDHFYLPEKYTDPFDNVTNLQFDNKYDLFIQSSRDELQNTTRVVNFDYRVLAPTEMEDMNANRSEVFFDISGMVIAVAVKGKGTEADNLIGYDDALANPTIAELSVIFNTNQIDETDKHNFLGNATIRHLYHFGEKLDASGNITGWCDRPAEACVILREKHGAMLATGETSLLQVAFECSDGMGTVLMKKSQAEPEPGNMSLRWIVSGKTILNNKGKPVKQYEPYFSDFPACEQEPKEVGVTPLLYYDAAGRLIRTEMPDGSFSRVEFSPWYVKTFDSNDTILEPGNRWYAERAPASSAPTEDKRAAVLSGVHANTPALTILDSLERKVIAIAHNRIEDPSGTYPFGGIKYRNEYYLTFNKLDAEGKPLWIRDARGNLVMQYITPAKANNEQSNDIPLLSIPCYDIAGNLLFQHSMDAGDRWMINDAAEKPMFAWDDLNNMMMSSYDKLHRPMMLELKNPSHPDWIVVGLSQYGEGTANDQANNLRGQAFRSFDQSGLVTNEKLDFKGNGLESSRKLAIAYNTDIDWRDILTMPIGQWSNTLLMPETFIRITTYDALNRMTLQHNWHQVGSRVAVYEPGYNERGLLHNEDLTIDANGPGRSLTSAIRSIRYDAKGQRLSISYGNNATTKYTYDPTTFRLLTLISAKQNNALLQSLDYTYDPVGNITEVKDNAIPTVFFNNFMVEPKSLYTYDALYRLIEAEGREHAGQITYGVTDNWNDCGYRKKYAANDLMAWRNYAQQYDYDSVGNFLTMKHIVQGDSVNSWTRQYQYALDSNRLLATGMGAAPTERYTNHSTLEYLYSCNMHGSMTGLPHLPTMDWDFTEHLKHISRSPASQIADIDGCADISVEAWYCYDASKQRTRKSIHKQGNIVEERFYLGGLEWYRRWSGNTPLEEIETLHLFDGQQRILMVDQVLSTDRTDLGTGTLYRYNLSNHLGSSSLELDENANIISYEEYHPYGTTAYQSGRNSSEVKMKRYRYTGMERDEESGLSYHGARYYAPWLGRWLCCDPGGIMDGPNLYTYGANQPNRFTDPGGRAKGDTVADLIKRGKQSVEGHNLKERSNMEAQLDQNEFQPLTEKDKWRALEKPQKVQVEGGELTVMDNVDEKRARAELKEINDTLYGLEVLNNEVLIPGTVELIKMEAGGKLLEIGGGIVAEALIKDLTEVGGSAIARSARAGQVEEVMSVSAKTQELRSVGAAARKTENLELNATHLIKETKGFPPPEEFAGELAKHRDALQDIIDNEGLKGLQSRIEQYAGSKAELEALRGEINASLGKAGVDQAWSHYPDMVLGADPFAIGGTVNARINSIIGPASKQWAEQIMQMSLTNEAAYSITMKVTIIW